MADALSEIQFKIPDAIAAGLVKMLPVREIRIIPTQSKSPANEFVDIVEIELALPNDGNCDWMQWMDVLRLRCERGKADGLLKTMGLK